MTEETEISITRDERDPEDILAIEHPKARLLVAPLDTHTFRMKINDRTFIIENPDPQGPGLRMTDATGHQRKTQEFSRALAPVRVERVTHRMYWISSTDDGVHIGPLSIQRRRAGCRIREQTAAQKGNGSQAPARQEQEARAGVYNQGKNQGRNQATRYSGAGDAGMIPRFDL